MEPVKVEEYRGYTIKVYPDEDRLDPREEWDNLGTMVCFHSRHALGDKHDLSVEEAQELMDSPDVFSLPLYLLDHSGLWMRTGDFQDVDPGKWDSGQVGWIYITKEKVRELYGKKRISPKVRKQALRCLQQEVDTYNDYLTGDVYGYILVDPNGDEINGCWGFSGDPDEHMIPEAQRIVDYDIERVAKLEAEAAALEARTRLRVVVYVRSEADEEKLLTREEAEAEKEHLEALQGDDIVVRLEEVILEEDTENA